MGSQLKRKQPSRGHLQKMRSAGDVLENLPKEILSDLDKPLDDGSSSHEPAGPVGGPPAPPTNITGKEVQPAPVPQPKPRPRAAPRKKPQPTPPTSEDGNVTEILKSPPPQAAPRSRAQTAANLVSPRGSVSNGDNERPISGTSPKHVPSGDKVSPVKAPKPQPTSRHPNVGPKPPAKSKSPVREPAGVPEDRKSPSRSRTCSLEGGTELEEKDPSQLTIKEKAMMAQKAFLPTPEKAPEKAPKPAPPVARKPKPTPGGAPVLSPEHTEKAESKFKRAQSLEEVIGASPPTRRKLPPGAFNIMGAVPMFGPASKGSADRGRSATVSTSLDREGGRGSVERGRGSVERQLEEELDSADGATLDVSEKRGEDDTDQAPPSEQATPNASSAPDISPKMPRKIAVDELAVDSDPLSNSDSPQAPSKFEHAEPPAPATKDEEGAGSADINLDVVLTWSPEVTAAWIGSVGLASYQQMFIEKEIQGFMLFDLDGNKLKVRRLHMQHTCNPPIPTCTVYIHMYSLHPHVCGPPVFTCSLHVVHLYSHVIYMWSTCTHM